MDDRSDSLAMEFARLRRAMYRPIGHARVAELEAAASANGRELLIVDVEDDGGQASLVLGWGGVEPAESTHAPRLPRRKLPQSAVRVLVVFYALITDPRTRLEHASTSLVEHVSNRLGGPGAGGGVERALSTTLSRAGLVIRLGDSWARGPVMLTWDAPTRTMMAHAAERLWAHPLWPETADE